MSRGRRRNKLDSIDQINMTPLIDLTFLLLIVFMITMPLVEYSTPVETPRMNAAPMPEKNNKIISLTQSGEVFMEKESFSSAALIERLTLLKNSNPGMVILLKADGGCPYSMVIDLMRQVKTAGFENVSLITGAED